MAKNEHFALHLFEAVRVVTKGLTIEKFIRVFFVLLYVLMFFFSFLCFFALFFVYLGTIYLINK